MDHTTVDPTSSLPCAPSSLPPSSSLLPSPSSPALPLLPLRLAATRLARAALANLRVALAAIRRFFKQRRYKPLSVNLAAMPPLAKFILVFPLFLLPFLSYVLLVAAAGALSPSAPASPAVPAAADATMFASLLSVTARMSALAGGAGPVAAPRVALQTSLGTREHVRSQDPMVRVVLACDAADPCCIDAHKAALMSVMRQSLVPNEVTILHACRDEEQRAVLAESADQIVGRDFDEAYGADKFVALSHCPSPVELVVTADGEKTTVTKNADVDMEQCLLRFMASKDKAAKPSSFVFVTTASVILEPTAIEKLWLYLFVRDNIRAVRPLGYDETSLRNTVLQADPMMANISRPNSDPTAKEPVLTLPIMYQEGEFKPPAADQLAAIAVKTLDDNQKNSTAAANEAKLYWMSLVRMMSTARVMRQAVFTQVEVDKNSLNMPAIRKKNPMLSLRAPFLQDDDLPAHLWSDHAFYKRSSRSEEDEIYAVPLDTDDQKANFDAWPMPFRKVKGEGATEDKPRLIFVMPWMQMGGSEKCMLDVAERLVKMDWPLTFVLAMPFWHQDPLGEMDLKHEWLDKALAITSDVFDVVSLAPNHKFSKVLRYLLETRSPDYILTGNARVIYEHTEFIKAVAPRAVIADYNHMVHMDWIVEKGKGGGMPRYGTTYSKWIDLHLTASDNVTKSMKTWIDPDMLSENPEKVKTCYIGTDPSALHNEESKVAVRTQMRNDLELNKDAIVVLFAGRFVADKGIDVMGEVLTRVSEDPEMAKRLSFVFVGSGELKDMLESTQKKLQGRDPTIIIQPPAVGIAELRNYYAMADIFLLPSSNEGIALVLYEAMAAGMLVMGTDVGGQKELIRTNTGILLPNLNSVTGSASFIVRQLQAITKFTPMFKDIQTAGTLEVRQRFTTEKFCDCVVDNMIRAKEALDKTSPKAADDKAIEALRPQVAEIMKGERIHGLWNRGQVDRTIEGEVTVGIKTYVCDPTIVRQVVGLVRSIRVNYPKVRILLANDGPTLVGDAPIIKSDPHTEEIVLPADSGISIGRNVMVNMTTTRYFVLLDDDHVFDEDTDLKIAVGGIGKENFDVVGIRVRNLPGIEELERISIFIPRYVAQISKFENRTVTLCVWNENKGPGVQTMRTPLRVDVLHNALIAKTDVLRAHPWRNILKVNEHMSFFLDARKAGVKVGYLPSVFVHHRARRYSACYKQVRFREDKYEQLLDYKDDYLWDVPCGDSFPGKVKEHLVATNGK